MGSGEFVSGPWTGYFTYHQLLNFRERTDLNLDFDSGRMTGCGSDAYGQFVIEGHYETRGGVCRWIKSYVGAHNVYYDGVRGGRGIAGEWKISGRWTGDFRIWPVDAIEVVDEEMVNNEETSSPLPAVSSPGKSAFAGFLRERLT